MPCLPTAQYLRASTGLQEFSLDNQIAVIKRYAEQHGFTIVQTFVDSGKSGVLLKDRSGLQQLLAEVAGGTARFKSVLVCDVSRWGRFQNPDESAHYEFLCRQAGIRVHYCNEEFTNDDAISNSILKALKRSRAAEYSRELSVKCFTGQKHLAELGFRVGAQSGFGLRRMATSQDRQSKYILGAGEYKRLATDRVTLVPGPQWEVECVRKIYDMALRHRRGPSSIARQLNVEGIRFRDGHPWRYWNVEEVLTNPKYAGYLVWNRTSGKLGSRPIAQSRGDWVVIAGAFEPLIEPSIFEKVQLALPRLKNRRSDTELLAELKCLLAQKGKLSQELVKNTPGMAGVATYYRRLGGFRRIYPLLGYEGEPGTFAKADQRKYTLILRDKLLGQLTKLFPSRLEVSYCVRNMRRYCGLTMASLLPCGSAEKGELSLAWPGGVFIGGFRCNRNTWI